MADGMFDDLVPKAKRQEQASMFDDLLPPLGEASESGYNSNPRVPIGEAEPLSVLPDFSNVIAGGPANGATIGTPDYSGAFREDNDGLGNIALRSIVGRAPDIIANLIELPANANEALTRQLGMEPSDTGIMGRMRGVLRSGADAVRDLSYSKDMDAVGYGQPTVSGAQLVAALNPGSDVGLGDRAASVGRFVPETMIASVPDMAATLNPLTLAGYIGSRTNEIAENRAANDQREDVSLGDLALGGVAAPIEALLERFTTMRLLPHGTSMATPGVLPAIARIAKELGLQGSLGGVEELVPYLAEQAGTERGADAQGALETFAGGAIAEGGLGGTVQVAKEAAAAARAPALGDAVPVADDDLDALLTRNLPPEILDAARNALGDLTEPAPSPASPATEPSPAPAAAQTSPVQPETPPTPKPAEPVAQNKTTPEGVQAPAAQSAPVSAGADLGDAFIDERGDVVAREGRSPERPLPRADRDQVLAMRSEIGWSSRGGELVREAPDASAMNEDERQGLVSQPKGAVIGRTPWVGQASPMGGESAFWRSRPTKWTEQQAHAAFDAFEAGKPLTKQQRGIVEYAQGVADTYAQAEAEQAAELSAFDEVSQQREFAGLREDVGEAIAQADRAEALSLYDLVTRAVKSGHPIESLDQPEGESNRAYAARLWQLSKEQVNGPDSAAAREDQASGDQGRASRNLAPAALGDFALETQPAAAEPRRAQEIAPEALGDFALQAPDKSEAVADDEARRTLAARQTGLFGSSETRRAADEQRDTQARSAPAPSVGGGLFGQARAEPVAAPVQPAARNPERGPETIAREVAKARPFDDVTEVRRAARDAIAADLGEQAADDLMRSGGFFRGDDLTQAVHDGQYEALRDYAAAMPVPVNEEQIGLQLASRAFNGTSHVPEERGRSAVRQYVRAMVGAWRQGEAAAGDDADALVRVTDLMRELQQGYAERLRGYLSSHANVASAMIAGPAKFPTERNRKRSEAADKRANEANEYLKRGIARMRKAAHAPVDNSPTSEVERVRANLLQREAQQARMKAANAAIKNGDEAALKAMGFDDAETARLRRPDFAGRVGFADFQLKNNGAEIRRLRDRLAQAEQRAQAANAGPTEREIEGVRVEENAEDDRIRLFFDGKPSEAVREDLRGAGWRWSPKAGAWQRQLTNAARSSAERILAKHYSAPLESKEEPQELTDDDLTDDERASFARQRSSGDHAARLKEAVDAALGSVASTVKYLPNHKSLPDRLRRGVESRLRQRGGSGATTALFDPQTGDVYLFTEANSAPDRAVFNIAHEIAGHQGLRALLGDQINSALDLALQNPTVAAVSEAIALERNIDASTDAGQRLAAEEALAELAAAVRTGNYDEIARRYGVDVPQGIRQRVAAAIANFLRRLKALLAKQGATFSDEDVRDLLENAWQAAQGNEAAISDPEAPNILESVEGAEAAVLDGATGRSVLKDGRLLTVIDAAKSAGLDLADLRAAFAADDAAAAVAALDTLLVRLRAPAAPLRSTGTKNAVTDAERAAANRDPILREAIKSNESTLYEAMRAVQHDPLAGQEAVARLSRGGAEGISLADEAVLLVYKTELLNKRDAAAKKLADAGASEDAKAVARRAWEETEAAISAVDLAAVNAGREWGRFGQFRQRMLKADFTFEALERKERARLERPLTADESATIKAMAATIAGLQAKVDTLQARVANAASESAYETMTRAMSRPPKQRKSLEYLRNAANDARARLNAAQSVPSRRGQSGAIMSPAVFYDYAVIGAYHIANGAAKFADWVGAMRADLGDAFDRIKAEHPNIFKASQQELEKPLKAEASVAEVMEKIAPANVTAKDVRKLIEALVGEGLRGESAVIGAAAEHLEMAEDEVRTLFVQTEPRGPQTLSEAQEELRDLRKLARLQNEIDRLEAGQPKPPRGAPAVDSAEVAAKKQELAELRQSLKPPRDPEGRYQEMRGKQIAKRIAELQERIERGDFAARPRVPRALSEANERAQFALEKAKHDFLRHQFEDNLRRRTPIGKVFGGIADTFNLARAMMTSLDLSAILRQGGFITYGHPLRGLSSVGPSLRAFASEQAEHRVRTEIESRRNAPLYRKYGLQLTGIGAGPLTQIEEAYASRWLERFPTWAGGGLIRGSGRAYTAFLNKLRADSFDAMAAALGRGQTLSEAEGKAIANFINVATGRGKVGASENAGQVLNTVFFAPRLVASRFQLLAGQPLYGGTPRTRKLIAQEYARFVLGAGVVIALSAFALGDDDDGKPIIGMDPRSSDFGKIRIGKTYLDPLAGLAQVTVLLARLATGETVTGGGAVKPLRPDYTLTDLRRALGSEIPDHKQEKDGGLPFGASSAADVIGRFLRTKLAPVPGAIVNSLSGQNVIGETVTPAQAATELVTPMSFQSIGDILEEQGIAKGSAITLLGLLGMGVQHRGSGEAKAAGEALKVVDAAKSDIEDRLATLPVEEWPEAFAKMQKDYAPLLNGVALDLYEKKGKFGDVGEPRMTSTGKPVLTFEGKDGVGSVMGELEGYPGFGKKGEYTTAGSRDRMKELDRVANVLGGDQPLTGAAAVRLTERMQLQLPAAQALYDTVQNESSGDRPISRKTRDALLEQVRFLRQAEANAAAEVVRAAEGGKPPAYNAARELVQKALQEKYAEP